MIDIKQYEKILDELDELECIKAYDKAKSRPAEFIPAKEMFETIDKKRQN